MTQAEQVKAFTGEIVGVVDRFRSEFDLTTAAAIGCLEMVKLGLFHEAMTPDDDE